MTRAIAPGTITKFFAAVALGEESSISMFHAGGGFQIYYQPIVSLRDNQVTGCEALLRWNHPERGAISPSEFIPVAEESGLISQLGEWVLKRACAEAATWPSHIKLAVNVSPVQFKNHTFALKVASALAASGLPASRLELEITEAILIGTMIRRWPSFMSSERSGRGSCLTISAPAIHR